MPLVNEVPPSTPGTVIRNGSNTYVVASNGEAMHVGYNTRVELVNVNIPAGYYNNVSVAGVEDGVVYRFFRHENITTKPEGDEPKAVNATITKFINATPTVQRHMIRAGFELETQESDGLTNDDRCDPDEDAIEEAISEKVSNILHRASNLKSMISSSLWDSIRDDVEESVRDNFDDSEYRKDSLGHLADQYNNKFLEVDTDTTVRGFEWRTKGGLPYRQFLKTLARVINVGHKVDSGCSFHVHVSIPGVKHNYGEKMQAAMVEYVVLNRHRLPEGARERLAGTEGNDYIKGLFSSRNKYSFVNYHEQGTWEFRCFGAIDTVEGGMECLKIATEALHFAYLVSRCKTKLLIDRFKGNKQELIYRVLADDLDLAKEIRKLGTRPGLTAAPNETITEDFSRANLDSEVTEPRIAIAEYQTAYGQIANASSLEVGTIVRDELVAFEVLEFEGEGDRRSFRFRQVYGVPLPMYQLPDRMREIMDRLPERDESYYLSISAGRPVFSGADSHRVAWDYHGRIAFAEGQEFYSQTLRVSFRVERVRSNRCELRQMFGRDLNWALVEETLTQEGLLVYPIQQAAQQA